MNGHDDAIEAAIINHGVPKDLFSKLDKLTLSQRLAIFAAYCEECGDTDPRCQCWNDE